MKKMFLLFAVLFVGISAYSQDATRITEILETPAFTRVQAAYIAATWNSPAAETMTEDQALSFAESQGFLKEGLDPNAAIRLDELSGLCMKAWDIPGGLFYRMTKANRYAYKELKALGYLPANADPSFTVSGAQGLDIIYRCMEYNNATLPTE